MDTLSLVVLNMLGIFGMGEWYRKERRWWQFGLILLLLWCFVINVGNVI